MIAIVCDIICGALWTPFALSILLKDYAEKKKRLLCASLICLVQLIASIIAVLTEFSELGLLLQFPIIGLLMFFILGHRWHHLLYIPVSYILIVVSNYIVEAVFIEIWHLSVSETKEKPIYIVINLMITATVVLLSFGLQKTIRFVKKLYFSKINRAMTFLIVGNVLLCMGVFLINGWAARRLNYPDTVIRINLFLFAAYALFTIVLSFIVFKVYHEREQIEHERQEQVHLQEYIKQVESMYEGLRTFKHDYINILAALSGYLEDEDYDGLKQYFDEYILPANQKINRDDYRLIQLSNVKQSSMKGVLSSKLIYAYTMGIDVFIDIMEEIDSVGMDPVDFTRVAGIWLDNAIEAANECENKKIKFNMVKGDNSVTIIIMNTFIDHEIPVSMFEKENFSTKGEGRGLGLYNVKEILKKYKNIYKSTEIKDSYFIQTLVIENTAI